jgi:hypothetical protein
MLYILHYTLSLFGVLLPSCWVELPLLCTITPVLVGRSPPPLPFQHPLPLIFSPMMSLQAPRCLCVCSPPPLQLIWRFFRLWSLLDGVDCLENMAKCMSSNYTVTGETCVRV